MARRKKGLPSWYDIGRAEKRAKDYLWELFFNTPGLREYPQHLVLGLERLETKCQMALQVIDFMEARGLNTVEDLADKLYIDGDAVEVLGWLRYPIAFRQASKKRDQEYLLALCDLEWDVEEQSYRPKPTERPT